MRKQPMISIYTVFNTYPLSFLREAIHGVRKQTYDNTEYIFVIYGKDNDLSGILKTVAIIDGNIKIYYKPDIDNFIKAIKYATSKCSGEYVCRADSEDILLDTAIEEMVKYKEDMIIPNHISIDNDGSILDTDVKGNIHNISSNCLIRKKLVEQTKYHDIQTCRDGYAILKKIQHSNFTLRYLDKPLFKYRENPGSITNNSRSKETIAFNEGLVDGLYM